MSRSRDWSSAGPLLGIAAAGAWLSEARAEEPEPLDEEFLDYLLQLEGDEEDWTLFDSQESQTPTAASSKSATAKSAPPQSAPPQSAPPQSATPPASAKEPVSKPGPAIAPKPTTEVKP